MKTPTEPVSFTALIKTETVAPSLVTEMEQDSTVWECLVGVLIGGLTAIIGMLPLLFSTGEQNTHWGVVAYPLSVISAAMCTLVAAKR